MSSDQRIINCQTLLTDVFPVVLKDDTVVGHIPYHTMAPIFSHFLKQEVNKVFAEVMDKKLTKEPVTPWKFPVSTACVGLKDTCTNVCWTN